jgi:hypothetical protein
VDLLFVVPRDYASFHMNSTKAKATSAYVGGDLRVRKNGCTESTLALAFPLPEGKEVKAYKVLAAILKEQLKNVPGVHVFVASYTSGGIWGFKVSGPSEKAVAGLHKAVEALKAAGNANIDAAKASATLEAGFACPVDLLQWGRSLNISDADAANYDNVSAQDVSGAVSASLKATPAFAVHGQTYGVPTYDKIAKLLR